MFVLFLNKVYLAINALIKVKNGKSLRLGFSIINGHE